ncbi:MAG: hypothetical protein K8L91_04285, partial [Anaerolineae bacterium]|nr:hypothetical protein [Anaerolineae bacterium]
IVQPPTLPPSATPTATPTATVTRRPSQTPRPTQVPPTATPTLTAVPRTIIPPDIGNLPAIPQGRVVWSGDLIAVSSGDTIHLLNASAFGQDGVKISTASDIQDVAISPDGAFLAAGGADGTVILWNLPIQDDVDPIKLVASSRPVWSVAFDPQNRWLAAGTDEGKIRLWEVQDQAQVLTQTVQGGPIFALAFDAEGNRLVVGGGQQVSLLDVRPDGSLQPNHTLSVTGETVQAAFSPKGVYLALATSNESGDVELWKLSPDQRIALDGHQRRINDVVFSDDGLLLVSGGVDNTARLWIMADVEIVAWHILVHSSPVVSVALNGDATQLITLTQDSTLTVWDVPMGTIVEKRQL